jgi:uncharacterized protein
MSSAFPAHLQSLMRPEAYPHPVERVQLVETHVSWVLLTGEFAYKIKRPVQFAFIDLRDPDRRAYFCAEELRLNRRFAPELYLDVCDIMLYRGALHVGGAGEPVERAVKMRQFSREHELDRLLADGKIDPQALYEFGGGLARTHAQLPVAAQNERWGDPHEVHTLLLRNLAECEQAAATFGTRAEAHALRAPLESRLDLARAEMEHRHQQGRVRECHGDLHSRNIVQLGERLVAFDCMEFEPAFRWIDVADDVAFLMSDLEARDRPQHAHCFLAGYLAESGDYQACRVLSIYKAHRCLVRAKVAALGDQRAEHTRLLEQARRALTLRKPRLLLMHGLSGSGKTWLAQRLAPRLRAVHIRSDVERKRLAGLGVRGRSASNIASGLYSQQSSEQTYAHLTQCAEAVLSGGYDVIVDATFTRRADRARFKALADRCNASLLVVHCQAPDDVLRQRIESRQQAGRDASEADTSVLQWQQSNAEPLTREERLDVLPVNTADSRVVADIEKRLGEN